MAQRGRASTGDAAGWSGWAIAAGGPSGCPGCEGEFRRKAEVVEFSPTLGPKTDVMAGWEIVSSGAGGVAPAVVAHFPVPTGAGVRFSAVAEVHASASEVDDDTLVVQASEQHTVRDINPGKAPRVVSVPRRVHSFLNR